MSREYAIKMFVFKIVVLALFAFMCVWLRDARRAVRVVST